jgi:endoglucanase
VSYATSPGSAVNGVDYMDTSGTLSFGVGVGRMTFSVQILGNTLAEADRTVNLKLTSVQIPLGTPGEAVITIRNNDVAGRVEYSAVAYSATAPARATITVRRSGGAAGPATIHYATGDGSAKGGTDYTPVSGTLTFNSGESEKAFTVDIVATGAPNRYLSLGLDTPTGGLKIGSQATAVLWILE